MTMTIGSRARVASSTNPHLIGLNGVILDETKNMMLLSTARGVRMVPKAGNVWDIHGETVSGDVIAKRFHQRLTLP